MQISMLMLLPPGAADFVDVGTLGLAPNPFRLSEAVNNNNYGQAAMEVLKSAPFGGVSKGA